MLEKIRVVAITSPERSYHVFYQIIAGLPSAAKGGFLSSQSPQTLSTLKKSSCTSIEGVDDKEGFQEIVDAMGALGIDDAQQSQLWSVLCGLLAMGNVGFEADGGEKASVSSGTADALSAAEELLGCGNLSVNLTSKGSGRKSLGALKLTVPQAQAARDAAIKDIFVHVFDWVVSCINRSIAGSEQAPSLTYIGLLDIFGFEVFKFNSFEQLCINFTNEKLQQFFLQSVFRAEQDEHAKEAVELSKIEIQDNQPCIDLLENKSTGIFSMLDTQCKTPNGSEGDFCKGVNAAHAKAAFLAPSRNAKLRDEEGFIIRHFAGNVPCTRHSPLPAPALHLSHSTPTPRKRVRPPSRPPALLPT